jgi:hypothetical protein
MFAPLCRASSTDITCPLFCVALKSAIVKATKIGRTATRDGLKHIGGYLSSDADSS